MVYYLIYNGILAALSPLVALYLTQRYFSGKSRPGWRERWGHLPESLRAGKRPRVWIHAVSAGEVVAAVPILRELRARLPEHELLFSVITSAGEEMAQQQAAPFVDAIFYCPFDLPWVTRKVVRALRPQAFVSLESELWPNLLHELKSAGVVTIMVNGRLSEKNYRRSSRARGFFRWVLGNMDALLVQSEADAERLRKLGAKSERVSILGNSKFDQAIQPLTPEEVLALRQRLHLPEDAPVLVAGSTRSAEEEAVVIAAYKAMQAQLPALCLILAPRQIDRAEEVAAALRAAGLNPARKTQLPETGTVSHLILDTMGDLANVYAVAAIAFVGNSFPPVVKGGGQNLLQPLAHGKPVLVGPHTATIRSEVALATEAGVGFQVADGAALAEIGLRLLQDDTVRCDIEARALRLIAANRGVSARYADAVCARIGKQSA